MPPRGGRFFAGLEGDRAWCLPAGEAHQRFSYERDREILGELDGAPPAVREEAPPAPPARAEPEATEAPRADGRRNPPPEYLYARKWRIFAGAVVGLFLALVDITIVNITIPTPQPQPPAGVG